jgi:hypothetical protein
LITSALRCLCADTESATLSKKQNAIKLAPVIYLRHAILLPVTALPLPRATVNSVATGLTVLWAITAKEKPVALDNSRRALTFRSTNNVSASPAVKKMAALLKISRTLLSAILALLADLALAMMSASTVLAQDATMPVFCAEKQLQVDAMSLNFALTVKTIVPTISLLQTIVLVPTLSSATPAPATMAAVCLVFQEIVLCSIQRVQSAFVTKNLAAASPTIYRKTRHASVVAKDSAFLFLAASQERASNTMQTN